MLKIEYKNDGACRKYGRLAFRLQAFEQDVKNLHFTVCADVFRGYLKKKRVFISYIEGASMQEFEIPYRCNSSFNRTGCNFEVELQYEVDGNVHGYKGNFYREFKLDDPKNVTVINNTTLSASENGIVYTGGNYSAEPERAVKPEVFFREISLIKSLSSIHTPVLVQIESGKELERGVHNCITVHFVPCWLFGEAWEFEMQKCSGKFYFNGESCPFSVDKFYYADKQLGKYKYEEATARIDICTNNQTTIVDLREFAFQAVVSGRAVYYQKDSSVDCSFDVLSSPEKFDGVTWGTLPVIEAVPKDDSLLEFALGRDALLEMVKVQAGSFDMGSINSSFEDEKLHHVVLKNDFWLGKFAVTQAQWRAVMGNNPSHFKGDKCPVEQVSWFQAREFCKKLTEKYTDEIPAGYKFDLPTEAQWEFAAKEGAANSKFEYSGNDDADSVAWYDENTGGRNNGHTCGVGLKEPNKLGLYDMSGNVWEWCLDNYVERNLSSEAEFSRVWNDSDFEEKIARGGSWKHGNLYCRVAVRGHNVPDFEYNALGFRIALVKEDM